MPKQVVQGADLDFSKYQLGWSDDQLPVFKAQKGINENVVREMSAMKNEEPWMLKFRLDALKRFEKKPMMPWFAERMPYLDFNDIYYYIKPTEGQVSDWEDLPPDILRTYERLGIPEAERNYLAGVTAQYESEVVFHRNRADLESLGVLFCDMDTAVRDYPEIVQKYFATVIPPGDNKFAALNSAVWSGGSFIYVPPGVKVDQPLQAYFRINSQNMGQFERTLIIADEGSQVTYYEGCVLAGTQISRPDGSTTSIEDIREGDIVLDAKGKSTIVTDTMSRPYNGDLHYLAPMSSGNEVCATSEHPVLAVPRSTVLQSRSSRNASWQPEVSTTKLAAATPQWTPISEVHTGDFLFYPVPQYPSVIPVHPAFMRLAGYYLAEGSSVIINKCKALLFSFSETEREYTDEVQDLCEQLWGTRGSLFHQKDRHALTVTVYTDAGHNAMRAHVGFRSLSKELSPLLMSQPIDTVSSLVDAYINGDGNRTELERATGTKVEWIRCHTISKKWALQLQALLARLGYFATVRMDRPSGPAVILGRDVTRNDLYIVQWTPEKVGGEIRKIKGGWLIPVKNEWVENYEGNVYNIATTSESYLVNGIAVHNCSAPLYSSNSLHSAVVELVALPGAHLTYMTLQNWSVDITNLVTKRARADTESHVEWVDLNAGSRLTMKYPSVYLMGPKASGSVVSAAYAGAGQTQDTGAKMIHSAPETTSTITSKSVSKDGGTSAYRGLVKVEKGATGAKSFVRCDALMLDEQSTSETRPYMEIDEQDASVGHEATVAKIGDDQLFYLMSRGLTEVQAMGMIVNGFIEPVTRSFPLEFSVEFTRLIEMNMEGSVG